MRVAIVVIAFLLNWETYEPTTGAAQRQPVVPYDTMQQCADARTLLVKAMAAVKANSSVRPCESQDPPQAKARQELGKGKQKPK